MDFVSWDDEIPNIYIHIILTIYGIPIFNHIILTILLLFPIYIYMVPVTTNQILCPHHLDGTPFVKEVPCHGTLRQLLQEL